MFSNDVDWVRTHFNLPEGCVFEPKGATIPEKIAMMSACRHFVITNSTFAWWAQFLGDYDEKIVVSPSHWFEDEEKPYPLIMDSFVKL